MNRTVKADFFERVWKVVAQIPCGKVTTYGHIAEHLGTKSAARTVGWALNAAAGSELPCHRVVNRYGALTGKRHFEGPHVMEERLRSEGVTFTEEGNVDINRHLWEPDEGLGDWDGEGLLRITVRVTDQVSGQEVERSLDFVTDSKEAIPH